MTGNWRTRSSESQKIRPRPHKPRVYTGAGSVVEYGKPRLSLCQLRPSTFSLHWEARETSN
jgi:hypothetical protein